MIWLTICCFFTLSIYVFSRRLDIIQDLETNQNCQKNNIIDDNNQVPFKNYIWILEQTYCHIASIDMMTRCMWTRTVFSTAVSISWWWTRGRAVVSEISSRAFYIRLFCLLLIILWISNLLSISSSISC